MIGTVEKINSKQVNTKFGEKTAYTIVIDGQYYSSFNNPGVQEGDAVEYKYQQNGKFKNLTDIKKSTVPAQGNSTSAQEPDKRQEYIIRQSSITRAIETLNSVDNTPKDMAEFVKRALQLSEIYTDFVFNGITDEIFNNSLFEVEKPKKNTTPKGKE